MKHKRKYLRVELQLHYNTVYSGGYTSVCAFVQEPVVHTSLEEAYESMLQFLRISCKKCHVSYFK